MAGRRTFVGGSAGRSEDTISPVEGILFPFLELVCKYHPFQRGVLTILFPPGSRYYRFEDRPFRFFSIVAHFGEELQTPYSPYNSPHIYTFTHNLSGFLLNLLMVQQRNLDTVRYGLALESPNPIPDGWIYTFLTELETKYPISGLTVIFHPRVKPSFSVPLYLEGYRTIVRRNLVKFYFRSDS